MILEGSRIYLRNIVESDASTLLKWGRNSYYHKTAGFAQYETLNQARDAVLNYQERPNSFAISLKGNTQMIGLIELYERGTDHSSGLLKTKEVGFLLDQDFEGHGYMTEALKLIFDYAFKDLKQSEIWAGTSEDNQKSQKLLEKMGFKYKYEVDYRYIPPFFDFQEKYYLLKSEQWNTIVTNAKS